METQIQGYTFSKRDAGMVTLFGYATKSLPGLEINGLGKFGKTLKEKIIFITRSRQLPIPLKRYVISTEYDVEQDPEALRWLELPILLLYWYLAGQLPMARLDNCLAVGHISPGGVLVGHTGPELVKAAQANQLLLLGLPHIDQQNDLPWIDTRDLLRHIPLLEFK